jgi:hypothetical protein
VVRFSRPGLHFLAVRNHQTPARRITKVNFGMLVGYLCRRHRQRRHPSRYDDRYYFSTWKKVLTYTGVFRRQCVQQPALDGLRSGIVGYAFLESPGNLVDGSTTDGDSRELLGVVSSAPSFVAEDFNPRVIAAGQFHRAHRSKYTTARHDGACQ